MRCRLDQAIALGLVAVLAGACSSSQDVVSPDDTTSVRETDAPTSESTSPDPASTQAAAATDQPSEDTASTDTPTSAPSSDGAPATAAVDQDDDQPDSEPEEPPTTELADAVTEDDLAVFLAAAEQAIEGTALEGTILDDPDIYISLAQSACARFSEGDDFDTVASDVLESLGAASNDDAILVGALLGAATGTICPEHADQI